MFSALLQLLLVLYELLLLEYPPSKYVLHDRLILETCAHGSPLVLDDLLVHAVDGHDLPHLVVDGCHFHKDDPIEQVARQLVLLEEF